MNLVRFDNESSISQRRDEPVPLLLSDNQARSRLTMDFKQALKGVHLTTHLTNSNQKTNNASWRTY